jgi:hypothetical protein
MKIIQSPLLRLIIIAASAITLTGCTLGKGTHQTTYYHTVPVKRHVVHHPRARAVTVQQTHVAPVINQQVVNQQSVHQAVTNVVNVQQPQQRPRPRPPRHHKPTPPPQQPHPVPTPAPMPAPAVEPQPAPTPTPLPAEAPKKDAAKDKADVAMLAMPAMPGTP